MDTEQIIELEPWVVHMPHVKLSARQFWEVCAANPDWRLELTADGDVIIMAPTGAETGAAGARITTQLGLWANRDGSGVAFDSSTGFELPNGAIRAPDAAWVTRRRLAGLTRRQKQKFLPLCPDFAIELKSPTDRLRVVQAKLREYVANGTRLGFLIDAQTQVVYVYRPHTPVRRLARPATLSGAPVLPGFTLDLGPIWDLGF